MPDAARLIAYAQSRDMVWMWRTRCIGGQWEAQVELHHIDGGATPRWSIKDSTEQAALDRAIEHAVDYWTATGATVRGILCGGS